MSKHLSVEDLIYDEYVAVFEELDGVQKKTQLWLGSVVVLGGVLGTTGGAAWLGHWGTRVDVTAYYIVSAAAVVSLVLGVLFLVMANWPQPYMHLDSMQSYNKWQSDIRAEAATNSSTETAPPTDAGPCRLVSEGIVGRLCEAVDFNRATNRRKLRWLGCAFYTISIAAGLVFASFFISALCAQNLKGNFNESNAESTRPIKWSGESRGNFSEGRDQAKPSSNTPTAARKPCRPQTDDYPTPKECDDKRGGSGPEEARRGALNHCRDCREYQRCRRTHRGH